ncbi:uncharacterized protein [Antedon mediterranea]|uniref:uncharacterized protein n=1 Tax=Antedon mediterranea TaxID=105859 RepID=UPI003AF89F25
MNIVRYDKDMFCNMNKHIPVHRSTRTYHLNKGIPGKISYEILWKQRQEKSHVVNDDQLSFGGLTSRSSQREFMNAQRRKQHLGSVLEMMGRQRRRHKRRRHEAEQFNLKYGGSMSDFEATEAYKNERRRRLAIPDNKMRTTYKDMMMQVDKKTDNTDKNKHSTAEKSQKRKFFSRVTLIILLLRMAKTYIFSESDRKLLNLYTALDAAQAADSYKIQNDLVFDITKFKASKKRRVSMETKRVLNLPTEQRTDVDIYHVQVELQRLKHLGRFPIEMQKDLIRNAWFESYEQHRVLIRYGRRPWTFYVILSGSAVILEGDPSDIGREVIPINPGGTFGEKAITDRRHHKITVISKERIELMCLSVDDYIDIFLATGIKHLSNSEDRSEHSNCEIKTQQPKKRVSIVNLTNQLDIFLRSIRIFDSWPIHLLMSNPDKCTFEFYKPKAIIVEDSRTSDWVYLIKSGSCAVMKILQYKIREVVEPVQSEILTKQKLRLHEHPFGYHENVIKQRSRAFFKNRAEQLKGKWIRPAERPTNMIQVKVRDDTHVKYDNERDMTTEEEEDREESKKECERKKMHKDRRKLENTDDIENGRIEKAINFTKGPFLTHKVASDGEQKLNIEAELEGLTAKRSVSKDRQINYLKIDTLEKGNVFGVLDLVFGEQSKLSLVSNGAECVLISKKFFTQHCNEETMKDISEHMRPYPNDETSRRDLKEKLNWRKKRDLTMQDVVSNFRRNISLRTQIRP